MTQVRNRLAYHFTNALVYLCLVPGCSVAVQADRVQCATDNDCAARGDAFTGSKCVENICQSLHSDSVGPWGCLGQIAWPAAGSGTHTVTVIMADIISNKPVPGLAARVCYKLDSTCISPMIPDLVSDAEGRITFQVPSGFDGFLESTGSNAFPFSYFFYPPITADRVVPNVPILAPNALAIFSSLVGVELSADRGHILTRVYNCQAKTAGGVRFSSPNGDASTMPFYMIEGIPSTKQSATDEAGNGGLLNVPPGAATEIATVAESGQTLGKPLSVVVRAGRITYTAMVPSP